MVSRVIRTTPASRARRQASARPAITRCSPPCAPGVSPSPGALSSRRIFEFFHGRGKDDQQRERRRCRCAEKTVRNYRQRRERIGISDSEPKIRVNKQGKRRPTKYKKRKPKKPSKAPPVLETYQPVCRWLQTDAKERGRLTARPRRPGGRPLGFAPQTRQRPFY